MKEYIDRDYLDAENLLLGTDITAYVEGLEDELFWGDLFRKFAPQLKIKFYPYTHDDQLKNGKQEVLKNLKNVGKTVILCIDSDLDFLLNNESICNNSYIFQTYAYAIENYKIFPYNLNLIVKKCSLPLEENFCFIEFFKEYSKVVYQLFLYILYFEKQKQEQLTILKLEEKIETEPLVSWKKLKSVLCCEQSQIDLTNNGFNLLESLKQKVRQLELQIINKYGNINLKPIDDELKQIFNINPEDIYWYLQGHILYDCVVSILLKKLINKYYRDNQQSYQSKLRNNPENQQITNKKREYENYIKTMDWKTLLQDGHNACLIYLDQCLLMQKIKVQIEQYLLNFSLNK